MTVNQEAFRAIGELIAAFPELHDQRRWETPPEMTGKCGTTRCIAGWATWWKAREMGLLSKKRQPTDTEIRDAVARKVGAEFNDYALIGQLVLGLDSDEAENLFSDFDKRRVVFRVESYAKNGRDLTDEELEALGLDLL